MNFRRYETFILLSPQISPTQLQAFKTKVDGIMSKGEVKIVKFEERGRQKLAYPVNKELFGYYILYDYRAKAELASELERNLKLDELVFKFLTLVLDKNFTEEKYYTVLNNIALEAAKKDKPASASDRDDKPRSLDDDDEDEDDDDDDDDSPSSPYDVGDDDTDEDTDNPEDASDDPVGELN
jgi:small subunit ribosomal protein S6